jgi:excisionase family DNA binding protein
MATHEELTELAATLAALAQTISRQPEPEKSEPRPMPERVLLTVEEAADQLGIGRTNMYSLIKSRQIQSVRIGQLRRISKDAISEYVDKLSTQQHAA